MWHTDGGHMGDEAGWDDDRSEKVTMSNFNFGPILKLIFLSSTPPHASSGLAPIRCVRVPAPHKIGAASGLHAILASLWRPVKRRHSLS